MYGIHMTEENNPNWKGGKPHCKDCGKLLSRREVTYCGSCSKLGKRNPMYEKKRGENHWNWQGSITPLHQAIRNCFEYKQWRNALFTRDNYTCQKCGSKENIETHHSEKSFNELFMEFLQAYDQFSPFEDQDTLLRLAVKWQPFWTAEGETLCGKCHRELNKKINNKRRTTWEVTKS